MKNKNELNVSEVHEKIKNLPFITNMIPQAIMFASDSEMKQVGVLDPSVSGLEEPEIAVGFLTSESRCLHLFRTDRDSYNTLMEMITEILGEPRLVK